MPGFRPTLEHTVPEQNLRVSLRRMPELPASRFVIVDVSPRPASDALRAREIAG